MTRCLQATQWTETGGAERDNEGESGTAGPKYHHTHHQDDLSEHLPEDLCPITSSRDTGLTGISWHPKTYCSMWSKARIMGLGVINSSWNPSSALLSSNTIDSRASCCTWGHRVRRELPRETTSTAPLPSRNTGPRPRDAPDRRSLERSFWGSGAGRRDRVWAGTSGEVGDTCTWWQVEAVTSAQRLRRPEESRKTTGKAWWKSARASWEGEREASQGWALTSGRLAQTQHCPTHQGRI